jgi:crotonobetainyl-CoA:carnitine CoA-transferase CaiB-like acyl-CoA transferase
LLRVADVFIEAFGAGRADSWNLGDSTLRPENAGLVYCSIKGFGSTGRYAGLKAYEGVVAAKAGLYSLGDFSFRDGPVFAGAPHASVGAAHFAVSAIAAALTVRQGTGRGQRVETTLVQGLTPMNYFGLMAWQLKKRPELVAAVKDARPAREGGVVASRLMIRACTSDGRWLKVTPQLPHQAQALMRAPRSFRPEFRCTFQGCSVLRQRRGRRRLGERHLGGGVVRLE